MNHHPPPPSFLYELKPTEFDCKNDDLMLPINRLRANVIKTNTTRCQHLLIPPQENLSPPPGQPGRRTGTTRTNRF